MEVVNAKKWDIQKLQESKEMKHKYQRTIQEKIGEIRGGEEGNIQENWKRIEKLINDVAHEIVGKEGNQRNKDWYDEECEKIRPKNSARKRMLQRETRANVENTQN
jgi:hemerythrin superfamily protein